MRALVVLELLACVLLFAPRAGARSGGIVGLGANGCNQCHSGGTAPMVTISADSTCLLAGSSTVIHFAITNTNGGGGGWNLRISSGGGTLSLGGPATESAGTRAEAGEITHSARKLAAVDDNLIHFSAVYTAPAAPTTATLLVWGNSVNNSGNTSGDRAASSTVPLTIAAPASCGTATCGTASDGCGNNPIDCGTCADPLICSGGACVCPPTAPPSECGIGQCFRTGTSCLPSSCTPGTPTGEVCNGLDDDCNGSADEGDLCPDGICVAGVCLFPVVDAGTDADSAALADAGTDAGTDDGAVGPGETDADAGDGALPGANATASEDATTGTDDGPLPTEDGAPLDDVLVEETTSTDLALPDAASTGDGASQVPPVTETDAAGGTTADADELATAGDAVATRTGANTVLDNVGDAPSAESGCAIRTARRGHASPGGTLLFALVALATLRRTPRGRRRSNLQ